MPKRKSKRSRRKWRIHILAGGIARIRRATSDGNRWLTPPHIVEAVRDAFGDIDLDPATEENNPTGALEFYTAAKNGLKQPWCLGRIFLNPPYSDLEPWIDRAIGVESLGAQLYVLVPVRTDASYHQRLIAAATDVLFLKGRLHFGRPDGKSTGTATFASMIVGLGISVRRLKLSGTIVVPTRRSEEAA